MTSQLLFTLATLLLATDFEALIFNDGCMELEVSGTMYLLPKEKVCALREMLNQPKVVCVLEQE